LQLRLVTHLLSSIWAMCYANGDGVAKDAEQAASWYRRAAEAGYADAQLNLGVTATQKVTGLPRMQSRPCRGTAEQLRLVNASAQINLGILLR